MKKILNIFKAIILTSNLAILPIACTKLQNHQNNVDISHIIITPSNVSVILDHDTYDKALDDFKKQVAKKITNLTSQKPQYGRDYKIIIANHDLYSKIEQYSSIDVVVQAAITTHILTGQFPTQINLVKPVQDISSINIPKQNYSFTAIGTTTFKDTIVKLLPIIQAQISAFDNSAKKDIDYVVNVEGHELTSLVVKLGDVNINVNAIHDEYHSLLTGAFTFVLTILTIS
ncbi:hypothetical protein [Spiroplasma sp. AdecLV25b]|uniref:hypothetical protein n=1 Tax=Spiroplasma sp. AdecLV25b TaxID=3027162 RepID=UPI0027DFBB24|nr:hypothetical protein [Spiroplasma sp. AdecLV25b]